MSEAFDAIADAYDQWYDTAEGRVIFQAELECLRLLGSGFRGCWLEVGVGTGRFAAALGVAEGVDPSARMLEHAARRGIRTHLGTAEHLPFPDHSFHGVLMALTLCFVRDGVLALRQCARVLVPDGLVVLGAIPADGPWGQAYARKAAAGHPLYSQAHFRSVPELLELADRAGLAPRALASAVLWKPDSDCTGPVRVEQGIDREAAFVGLLLGRPRSGARMVP